MKQKLVILCALLVLFSGALALFLASKLSPEQVYAANGGVASSTKTVTISQYKFEPRTLTITVGTTVIWTNNDSAAHTVTSTDGETFDSGNLPSGGAFSFKFTTAGTFAYYCRYHRHMPGTIVVK